MQYSSTLTHLASTPLGDAAGIAAAACLIPRPGALPNRWPGLRAVTPLPPPGPRPRRHSERWARGASGRVSYPPPRKRPAMLMRGHVGSLFAGRTPGQASLQVPERPPGSIRVAVLCPAALFRESLEAAVRSAPDMQVVREEPGARADVVLCAAESGGGLRLLAPSTRLGPAAGWVLLDTAGLLGPFCAGLRRFRGYCPPKVGAERLLTCVRRVAKGEIDAPRPHLVTLVRAIESPPLEERDMKILSLLALGRSNDEMVKEVPIKERTLQDHLHRLADWFGAADRYHLAAIAVALNLGWPFEEEPPDGWLMPRQKK